MNELFPISSELANLAHRIGGHPSRLVLGSEGAVAARLASGQLAVSAAGAVLARLDARGLVEYDLARTQALAAQESVSPEELAEAAADPGGSPPCDGLFVFADLFAFETVQFAAHTHPVPVNQILCSPRARQFADRRNLVHEVIACGQASVLVPFQPPGLALAREVKRRLALWQDRYRAVPKIILIQNHGMIALGETVDEVLQLTELTVKYAEIFIGAALMGGPDFLKPTHVTQIEAAARPAPAA